MKHKIYVVHDAKAEAFLMPFVLRADAQAIRGFSDAVNKEDTDFYKHPSDYTLFNVGEYSDVTGKIEPCEPRSLGNGVEFKGKE